MECFMYETQLLEVLNASTIFFICHMLDFVCKILFCDIPDRKSVKLKIKFSVFKKFNCVTGFNCVMDLNHSPKFHSQVPALNGILWEKVKIMLARPGSALRCTILIAQM